MGACIASLAVVFSSGLAGCASLPLSAFDVASMYEDPDALLALVVKDIASDAEQGGAAVRSPAFQSLAANTQAERTSRVAAAETRPRVQAPSARPTPAPSHGVPATGSPPTYALGVWAGAQPQIQQVERREGILSAVELAALLSSWVETAQAGDPSDVRGRLVLRLEPDTPPVLIVTDPLSAEDLQRAGLTTPGRVSPGDLRLASGQTLLASSLAFDYQPPVSSGFAGGIEVALAPRAGVVVGDRLTGASAGAVVRFGENLSAPRSGSDAKGWYMFAGADAQAVTWKPDRQETAQGAAMRVEDMQFVGDAQAGIGWRVGPGDLAVGFVHREVKAKGYTAEEQFGGVTFVLNR